MNKNRDIAAIAFTLIFPTLVTLVYFQWLKDSPSSLQQIAFGIGKVLQFGFPVVYVWFFHADKLPWRKSPDDVANLINPKPFKGIGLGIVFGCLVAVAMFTIFFTLIPFDVTERLRILVSEKITSIGVDTPLKYFGLAVFYTACHSFMEEYYWRWFVFDVLRKHTPAWLANVVSSLGFMAHHVIVLGFFFGWTSPLTYLLSFSIAVGGSVWAVLYDRSDRLRSAWISHAIVDAAIFGLGYWLRFGS